MITHFTMMTPGRGHWGIKRNTAVRGNTGNRFAGGHCSNIASHVVAHLDREYMWQHPKTQHGQQLRSHLLTGLAVVNRSLPILSEYLLEQVYESFPNVQFAPSQTSLTRESLEFVVQQRSEKLPNRPDEELLAEAVQAVSQLAGTNIAGARAVRDALMILEDVVSDKSSREGMDN